MLESKLAFQAESSLSYQCGRFKTKKDKYALFGFWFAPNASELGPVLGTAQYDPTGKGGNAGKDLAWLWYFFFFSSLALQSSFASVLSGFLNSIRFLSNRV